MGRHCHHLPLHHRLFRDVEHRLQALRERDPACANAGRGVEPRAECELGVQLDRCAHHADSPGPVVVRRVFPIWLADVVHRAGVPGVHAGIAGEVDRYGASVV